VLLLFLRYFFFFHYDAEKVGTFILTGIFSLILLIHPQNTSYASGTFFGKPGTEVIPTESKAAIFFDGKEETIFESVTFNANPVVIWNFAWLIAVPSKPDVSLVKDDLFAQLSKISEKKVIKNSLLKKLLFWDIDEAPPITSELFTRPVNISKLDVLSPPHQTQQLKDWVSYSGYLIPKQAESILNTYEQKNWYFIIAEIDALHLELAASESLTLTGAHTFPLKITFPTDKIIYPMKLTTIQPDTDTAEIPLTYTYGSKSEDVLGEKDEIVDALLSTPSANKYPKVPFSYNYYKSELYVFAKNRITSDLFLTTYANSIDKSDIHFQDPKGNEYYSLPNTLTFLTKLVSIRPVVQLDDVVLTDAKNNTRVNAYSSLLVQYIKLISIVFIALFCIFIVIQKRRI
jgi:hypothetical protein